jgi:hypothetical protein
MSESKELSTLVKMTKAEAEATHQKIGQVLVRAGRDIGALCLDMRDRRGYEALGCKTFEDYINKKVTADFGGAQRSIYNYMAWVEVERALHASTGKYVQVPLRYALVMYPVREKPELLLEAYEKADSEQLLKVVVGRLLPKPKSKKQRDKTGEEGWTKEDLESDTELRNALDKIQDVYGKEARMAIQNGIVVMPRREVLELAKVYAPTMLKIERLILANRWSVKESVAFVNDSATETSTVEELINWCLTEKSLHWVGTFGGFEITVKATPAAKKKIAA